MLSQNCEGVFSSMFNSYVLYDKVTLSKERVVT